MGQQEWNRDSCPSSLGETVRAPNGAERKGNEANRAHDANCPNFSLGNFQGHQYDVFRDFYEALRQFAIRPVLHEAHGLHAGLSRCMCITSTYA